MKKKILISAILLLSFYSYGQRIAFYDAQYLKSSLDSEGKFRLSPANRELFSFYLGTLLKDAELTLALKNNPFFKNYFETAGIQSVTEGLTLPRIASSLGGLDVTKFADGMAKFLAERVKDELSIAFFDKMKEQFSNYPEFKIFFPNSYNVLTSIESYQFSSMLQTLKQCFENDIMQLPVNISHIKDMNAINCNGINKTLMKSCQTRMEDIQNLLKSVEGSYLKLGMLMLENISLGYNPAEIIHNIAISPESDELGRLKNNTAINLRNGLMLVDLVSQNLRNKENNKVWVTPTELNSMFNDTATGDLFFGLLYHLAGSGQIKFNRHDTLVAFKDILGKFAGDTRNLIDFIKKVSVKNVAMNNAVNNLSRSSQTEFKPDFNDYYNYFHSVIHVFHAYSNSIHFILDSNQYEGVNKLYSKIDQITPAIDMVYNITLKNYSAAILKLVTFIGNTGLIKDDAIKKNLLKYGTFISTVASSQNSEDVKNAISAIALPTGSYTIKRNSELNISLNAFVGPFYGYEYLPALKKRSMGRSIGITAPVGIAFNWGKYRKHETRNSGKQVGYKSFSIFVPIIDIGAMTAYRFNNDSSSVSSNVKLSNIISPGLYFYYGFGKCPLSLGFGAQIGPQLRDISANNIHIDKNYYIRYGINLVVDIPVFNFYSK